MTELTVGMQYININKLHGKQNPKWVQGEWWTAEQPMVPTTWHTVWPSCDMSGSRLMLLFTLLPTVPTTWHTVWPSCNMSGSRLMLLFTHWPTVPTTWHTVIKLTFLWHVSGSRLMLLFTFLPTKLTTWHTVWPSCDVSVALGWQFSSLTCLQYQPPGIQSDLLVTSLWPLADNALHSLAYNTNHLAYSLTFLWHICGPWLTLLFTLLPTKTVAWHTVWPSCDISVALGWHCPSPSCLWYQSPGIQSDLLVTCLWL